MPVNVAITWATGGLLLADRDVDADVAGALLVDDGVENDRVLPV